MRTLFDSDFLTHPGASAVAHAPGISVLSYPATPHEELSGWCSQRHALSLYLGVRVGNGALASDALRLHRWQPYTLLYRPPGASFQHDCLHAADLVEVLFDEPAFAALSGSARIAFEPVMGRSAPQLAAMARAVNAVLYSASRDDALAVEQVALDLLATAAEAFGEGGYETPGHSDRALDATRLGKVLDLVEAHLDESLGLADLADEVGLNMHHFAKAFRATTGSTPYQHLTARRVSRARMLLEREERDIASIALECGFSSQSHLTEQFRRAVGTTPSRYRRFRAA